MEKFFHFVGYGCEWGMCVPLKAFQKLDKSTQLFYMMPVGTEYGESGRPFYCYRCWTLNINRILDCNTNGGVTLAAKNDAAIFYI